MKIVIFGDKHSDDIYDISTPELKAAVGLHVLKERLGDYIPIIDDNDAGYVEARERFKNAVADHEKLDGVLDDDSIALREATRELRSAQSNYNWYRDQREMAKKAQEALDTNNYDLAWDILGERRDYEYEGYTIVTPKQLDIVT